jgi:nucleotide-binding universal stress UspA family protein
MIKMNNILFPTDFSDFSKYAASFAISFACDYGAKLYVLHVVEIAHEIREIVGVEAPPMEEIRSRAKELAIDEIKEAATPELFEKLDYEVACVRGKPFAEIIGFARDNEADMIVMGTHGRGALMAAMMGSTAEKVVRKSPCPVFTVRLPGHGFVMPAIG